MTRQLGLQLTQETVNCLFCSVISGVGQATVVYETEKTAAFLDNRPLFHGHTLVAPRQHVETLSDLPVEEIPVIFGTVRVLAMAVERAMSADGTFIAINNRVSQSIPHLHVHVVPRRRKDGLRGFFWPRVKYDDEEHLKGVATAIRQAINDLGMTNLP